MAGDTYDNDDSSDDGDDNDDIEGLSYHGRVNDCSKWPRSSSYPNTASCFR